jgi:hypothetical protein
LLFGKRRRFGCLKQQKAVHPEKKYEALAENYTSNLLIKKIV